MGELRMYGRFCSLLIATYLLTGCAVFERKFEEPEDPNAPPFPPSTLEATELRNSANAAPSPGFMDNELTRMNSKIEALETKMLVLEERLNDSQSSNLQPQMIAEPPIKTKDGGIHSAIESVFPTKAKSNSKTVVRQYDTAKNSPVEQEFQAATALYQKGQDRESSNKFFGITKKYKDHALASHALYWAGKAGSRARNWKVAIQHWKNLENNHPRSPYLPHALAGLSRAHAATGNIPEARHYRELLLQAFPNAPPTIAYMNRGMMSPRSK